MYNLENPNVGKDESENLILKVGTFMRMR